MPASRSGCEVTRTVTAAILAAAVVAVPRAAHAQLGGFLGGLLGAPQISYCLNCSSETTQLLNKVQLIGQFAKQVQQYQKQIQQYADQVQNSATVSRQVWGHTLTDVQQVNTLLNQAQSLAYSTANLNQQFAQRYRTFGTYAGQPLSPTTMAQKYQQWSQESNDNVLYALRGANAQAAQMNAEDTDLHALEAMATSASGRMQAIQVGNQFAAQSARQLQKLRQLLMLNMQVQANAQQFTQDRDAYQQAAGQRALAHPGSAATGGIRF